jgi:hypothetical protein
MPNGPKLPPKDTSPIVSVTLRVRQSMVDRLDRVVSATGHARHQVLVTFLEWALEGWEAEHPAPTGGAKGPGGGG